MKRLLLIIPLALGLVMESTCVAAVDYFLKLEGIDGESTDDRHRNEIQILSFHWGMTQQGDGTNAPNGGGGGAGKVVFQDVHFVAKASKASPKLMLACASGQHIGSVRFVVHRSGGDTQEYLTITMKDVYVTSYQTGGSPATTGDSVPTDQFSVNFVSIKFTYTAMDGSEISGEATRPTITQ